MKTADAIQAGVAIRCRDNGGPTSSPARSSVVHVLGDWAKLRDKPITDEHAKLIGEPTGKTWGSWASYGFRREEEPDKLYPINAADKRGVLVYDPKIEGIHRLSVVIPRHLYPGDQATLDGYAEADRVMRERRERERAERARERAEQIETAEIAAANLHEQGYASAEVNSRTWPTSDVYVKLNPADALALSQRIA